MRRQRRRKRISLSEALMNEKRRAYRKGLQQLKKSNPKAYADHIRKRRLANLKKAREVKLLKDTYGKR